MKKRIDYKDYTRQLKEWLKEFSVQIKKYPGKYVYYGKAPSLFVKNTKFRRIRDYVCAFQLCPDPAYCYWWRFSNFEQKLDKILEFTGKFEDIVYTLNCGHSHIFQEEYLQCNCGKWYYDLQPINPPRLRKESI